MLRDGFVLVKHLVQRVFLVAHVADVLADWVQALLCHLRWSLDVIESVLVHVILVEVGELVELFFIRPIGAPLPILPRLLIAVVRVLGVELAGLED